MKITFPAIVVLLCAAAPAFAVPITVVIVGPDKRPLPDARLDVFDSANEKERAASREIVGMGGRFSFNWNGKFAAPNETTKAAFAMEHTVLVRAQAPGLATKITFIDKNAAVIELGKRRAWGGSILDQKQRPIVGATVALQGIWVTEWQTQTTTDANGRWQMDDLPVEGQISIKVSAPNHIAADYGLSLANAEAPPLFLKPGATITGQIVTPAGKPIENAPVIAEYDFANVARTDKAGRFALSGVAAGEVSLRSVDPFDRREEKADVADYVVADFDKVRAVAGQTTDVGQWKAIAGTTVKVRAVDATTGKPLTGAIFMISRNFAVPARADAQGFMRAHLLPDTDNYPFIGRVGAENYIDAQVPRLKIKPTNGEVDLGTFELKRGTSIKGVIRVQGETPQNNEGLPMLALQGAGDTKYIRFWGNTDAFATDAMTPSNYKVSIQTWRGQPDKDWQIIAPLTLTVPAPDAKTSPVEIVVKRLNKASAPIKLREVRGQILDEDGQGVGGVLLELKLKAGGDGSYSEIKAVTGINGKWSQNTGVAANKVEVESIERPGYIAVGAARSEIKEGIALVSGLSMKRSGGVFAGRVVNANGTAATDAWVTVAEIENYPAVQADENGAFQLIDVPLDKFTLLAADANGFARQSAASDAKSLAIELKPNAEFDREAIINDALAGDFEWWRISDLWDYIGSERMGELARRGGKNGDWSRYRYALELAQREPKNFGARRGELTQELDDDQQAEIVAEWNWARALAPDEAEKFELNDWVDAQKSAKRAIDAANVTQLLRVAAVAHRLGRDDAADLSDYAAAIAAQLKVDGNTAENWGDPLARSGYAAAQSFVEGMKPVPEFKLWWTAAGDIAEAGEIEGAQKALARMEVLAATPEWIELAARESWNNPTYQIEQVRAQIARALAKTDVASAQQLAASIEEQSSRTETSLFIADRAIEANQPAVAEAALRVAMQLNIGNPENYALAASLAQQVSPRLGAELWADALLRAVPTEKREAARGTFWPSVAMWAFYHARLNKGRSRVLLEREWNWRLPAAIKAGQDKEVDENDVASIDALVMAMAVVDPARALEMRAQAAREVKALAGQANIGLAAALLMSEEQQARWGVGSRMF